MCGIADTAFMSTTTAYEEAYKYALKSPSSIIFEISQGLVDRGADISCAIPQL
jgi:hypothetical protein